MRIVGTETQVGRWNAFRSQSVKSIGLHEPVFVMTAFWPRIGKEHKDALENNLWRQCGDEFGRFGLEENEVGELGAVAFARGTFHAITEQIEAEAKFCGMRLRVIGEEMPVTCADFERDAGVRDEQIRQLLLEAGAAGVAMGDELGGAGGSVHAAG